MFTWNYLSKNLRYDMYLINEIFDYELLRRFSAYHNEIFSFHKTE